MIFDVGSNFPALIGFRLVHSSHGRSNIANLLTRSEYPPNPNSEAARDLRYEYGAWKGSAPNPQTDNGVYLFGGSESNSDMHTQGFFNNNVDCLGGETDAIVGINTHIQYGDGYMCQIIRCCSCHPLLNTPGSHQITGVPIPVMELLRLDHNGFMLLETPC